MCELFSEKAESHPPNRRVLEVAEEQLRGSQLHGQRQFLPPCKVHHSASPKQLLVTSVVKWGVAALG